MGATSNLGLPYPEDTDLVIEGDDAIQSLAEAIDNVTVPAYMRSNPNAYVDQAVGSGVTLEWGTLGQTGDFTGTSIITYTGPTRVFMITVTATVAISSSSGSSDVTLYTGSGSQILLYSVANHNAATSHYTATHTLTTITVVPYGANFHVDVTATGGMGAAVNNAHIAACALTLPNI